MNKSARPDQTCRAYTPERQVLSHVRCRTQPMNACTELDTASPVSSSLRRVVTPQNSLELDQGRMSSSLGKRFRAYHTPTPKQKVQADCHFQHYTKCFERGRNLSLSGFDEPFVRERSPRKSFKQCQARIRTALTRTALARPDLNLFR